jgi:hypothetical protein
MAGQLFTPNGVHILGRPKAEDFPMMSEVEINQFLESVVTSYESGQLGGVPIGIPLGAALRMAKTLAAQRFLLGAIQADIAPLIEGGPERPLDPKNATALKDLLGTPQLSVSELAKYHA